MSETEDKVMADRIRVLLTEEEVDRRINEMAAEISEEYEGRQIHLICILKGGVFFTCCLLYTSYEGVFGMVLCGIPVRRFVCIHLRN